MSQQSDPAPDPYQQGPWSMEKGADGASGYEQQDHGRQSGYGQQPGYGAAYGQQPGYGQPAYGYGSDATDVLGPRIGQYLLDALVSAVPALVIYVVLGALGALIGSSGSGAAAVVAGVFAIVGFLLVLAVPFVVYAYWPSTHGGQTPAMQWLGLRIVREEDGGVPSLGQTTIRWLLLIVDGAFAGLVGLILIASTQRHQRLGDIAAKTLVVRA